MGWPPCVSRELRQPQPTSRGALGGTTCPHPHRVPHVHPPDTMIHPRATQPHTSAPPRPDVAAIPDFPSPWVYAHGANVHVHPKPTSCQQINKQYYSTAPARLCGDGHSDSKATAMLDPPRAKMTPASTSRGASRLGVWVRSSKQQEQINASGNCARCGLTSAASISGLARTPRCRDPTRQVHAPFRKKRWRPHLRNLGPE